MPNLHELNDMGVLLGYGPWEHLPRPDRIVVFHAAVAAKQAAALERIASCESGGYFDTMRH